MPRPTWPKPEPPGSFWHRTGCQTTTGVPKTTGHQRVRMALAELGCVAVVAKAPTAQRRCAKAGEPNTRPRHWPPVTMRRNIWRIRLEAQLATLPLLANCDRRALRRIAQWADVVEVDRGEVLVRENHGDFWFFVVLQGEVRFTRKKSQIATVGPGSYFGENAIVGLRPQQATATTTESSTLLVIGARYFLSLLATSPAFQRALFPDVDPGNYTVYAKQMRAKGAAEWRQLPPLKRSIPKPAGLSAPLGAPNGVGSKELAGRDRAPGRPLSRREAISLLASMPAQTQVAPPPPPKPLPKWVWAVAGGIATAPVSLVLSAQ